MTRARDLADSADKDIVGTLAVDGLTVDGTASVSGTSTLASGTNGEMLFGLGTALVTGAGTYDSAIRTNGGGALLMSTGTTKRLSINTIGDISFYEDTGTTAKFFWDASAESLGIGTSSPSTLMHISGISASTDGIHYIAENTRVSGGPAGIVMKSTHGDWKMINSQTVADALEFIDGTAGATRMLIDSSGNVGIGTTSTSLGRLTVVQDYATNGDTLVLKTPAASGGGSQSGIKFVRNTDATLAQVYADTNSGAFITNVAGSEAMRIDSSGNVGIGTTSLPTNGTNLKVEGSTISRLVLANTGDSTFEFCSLSGGSLNIYDATADVERMRITNSGAVAIGDTNPTRHGQATKALIYNGSGTTAEAALHCSRGGTGTETQIAFSNAYGVRGNITTTASAVSYNTTSDYRLKENVTDVTDGITRVKQLAPKRFNFIADPDTTVDGFLAHEAQAVVPEAVTGTQDALDAEGNPDYQGIDQSKLVPLLTAALQEAIAKIETLETKVAALEAN